MKEVWKDVIGYEGLYQISNLGRIKRLDKLRIERRRTYVVKEKIMKPNILITGYYYVNLYKNSKPKHKTIHRLVAQAFISNPENKPFINHKDGNKLNNCVYNLEWVTCGENNIHALNTGLRTHESRMIKISQYKGDKLIATYKSMREAKRMTNISLGNISSAINGIRNTAGGYVWKKG